MAEARHHGSVRGRSCPMVLLPRYRVRLALAQVFPYVRSGFYLISKGEGNIQVYADGRYPSGEWHDVSATGRGHAAEPQRSWAPSTTGSAAAAQHHHLVPCPARAVAPGLQCRSQSLPPACPRWQGTRSCHQGTPLGRTKLACAKADQPEEGAGKDLSQPDSWDATNQSLASRQRERGGR